MLNYLRRWTEKDKSLYFNRRLSDSIYIYLRCSARGGDGIRVFRARGPAIASQID